MFKFLAAKAAVALALLLGLAATPAAAQSQTAASGSNVNATVKIFNYSKYEVYLRGRPQRFESDRSLAFEVKKGPPAAKGQMALLLQDVRFVRLGSGAGTDSKLFVELNKGGRWITCYVAVAYGKSTKLGMGMDLGVGPPEVQGCEGVKVDWRISQNDLEIYIDLPQASWAMR
jgi:hypothetical protein